MTGKVPQHPPFDGRSGNGYQPLPRASTQEKDTMSKAHQHLQLLGHRVQDKVTGLEGVVTSVCFDLYECIMAAVHPGIDANGKPAESNRFDVSRLTVLPEPPVMQQPDFVSGDIADGKHGPADKPAMGKV